MLIAAGITNLLNTNSRKPSLTSANSRLTKSLRELNDSITSFEHIYARHRERAKYPSALDDNVLEEVLQQTISGEDIFHNATVLENRIIDHVNLQTEGNGEQARRRSNCLHVAKLIPLVKLFADIGGVAAQVSFLSLIR